MPPTLPPESGVSLSVPEPWLSFGDGQLASGFAVELPEAVRQAEFAAPLAVELGTDTEPAGPSTVLSLNGWLKSTVPEAFGICGLRVAAWTACAVWTGNAMAIPLATKVIVATMAARRGVAEPRRARRRIIPPNC